MSHFQIALVVIGVMVLWIFGIALANSAKKGDE